MNPENLPHILEFEWRRIAFFDRVPLGDLAILYPLALECQNKEESLAEDVERLTRLNALAVDQCPEELGRLAKELPGVGRQLRSLPGTGGREGSS